MKKFGSTFKEIRLAKRYTLKEVAHNIVSVQFLSNFENDKSDITLSNFMALLKRINVPIEDFMYYHNDDRLIDINRLDMFINKNLNHEMNRFELDKMSKRYQQYYDSTNEQNFLHLSVLFEMMSVTDKSLVPESRTSIIKNYLLNCEFWGRYELFLAGITGQIFSIEEKELNYSRASKQVKNGLKTFYYPVHALIINEIFSLIRENYIEEAKLKLDDFYKDPPIAHAMEVSEYLLADFLQGLILLAEGNEKGEEKCQNYLESLSHLPEYTSYINVMYQWISLARKLANKN